MRSIGSWPRPRNGSKASRGIGESAAELGSVARQIRAAQLVDPDDLVAHFPLDGDSTSRASARSTSTGVSEQRVRRAAQAAETASASQFQDGEPQFAPGRIGQAASFDGKRFILGGNIGAFGFQDKFTLAAWIYPTADTGADHHPHERCRGRGRLWPVSEEREGSGQPDSALAGRWSAGRDREADRAQSLAARDDDLRRIADRRGHQDLRGWTTAGARGPSGRRESESFRRETRCGSAGAAARTTGSRARSTMCGFTTWRCRRSMRRSSRRGESIDRDRRASPPAKRNEPQTEKITLYFLEHHAPPRVQQAWRELAERSEAEGAICRESSDRHGDAGARHAARHVPAASRRIRQARRQSHAGSSRRPASAAGRVIRTTGSALRAGWSIRRIR